MGQIWDKGVVHTSDHNARTFYKDRLLQRIRKAEDEAKRLEEEEENKGKAEK